MSRARDGGSNLSLDPISLQTVARKGNATWLKMPQRGEDMLISGPRFALDVDVGPSGTCPGLVAVCGFNPTSFKAFRRDNKRVNDLRNEGAIENRMRCKPI